jgi:hypothetical protein
MPEITSEYLHPSALQVYADGAPLVQVRHDPETGLWVLPMPAFPQYCLTYRAVQDAVAHVEHDAETLSQRHFAAMYPRYVRVTTRELDATLHCVERAGMLLAHVYQQPDTGRWSIMARRRHVDTGETIRCGHELRTRPTPDAGFEFRDSAFEFVLRHVHAFTAFVCPAVPAAVEPAAVPA